MQNNLAPICLFTYNRLEETKQTIEALQNNFLATKSNLYIFSDGPKTDKVLDEVLAVRNYIKNVKGFKSIKIFESFQNKGLAASIIDGVSKTLNKYSKVIVLEDDLLTSPNFLNFMNQALNFYAYEERVQSINGFSLDIVSNDKIYFQTRPFPWGWATWRDKWNPELFNSDKINDELLSDNQILIRFKRKCGNDISRMLLKSLRGTNDSWYVKWTYNHFRNNKVSVYPKVSFVENIGYSEAGTHCNHINTYTCKMITNKKNEFDFIKFSKLDNKLENRFLHYFTTNHKIIFRLKLLFNKLGRKIIYNELKNKINDKLFKKNSTFIFNKN